MNLLVYVVQFLARGGRGNDCKIYVYIKRRLDYKTKFTDMPNFLKKY